MLPGMLNKYKKWKNCYIFFLNLNVKYVQDLRNKQNDLVNGRRFWQQRNNFKWTVQNFFVP